MYEYKYSYDSINTNKIFKIVEIQIYNNVHINQRTIIFNNCNIYI